MYNDHFGLTGRPFQLTPDPRFWFESATHKKAMAYLGYGLAQGEGFVVITGEVGAGKTILTGHLLESVDPNRVHAVRIVSSQLKGDELLRMVALGIGLDVEGAGKPQLLARIEAQVQERARAGQRVLLIIDEAQSLAMEALEELRMLSNFQGNDHALIQLLLLGQPEFRERLNTAPDLEQLRQRVIASHHLTGMEANETGPYILHRMKQVGWAGTPAFSDAAFAAIHRYSGGLPRRINNLMTRVLLLASMEKSVAIDAALVEAVVADMATDQAAAPAAETQGNLHLVPDAHALDLAARVAMLEAQLEEQGAALRRVLGLLVEWVEADETQHQQGDIRRAPAA